MTDLIDYVELGKTGIRISALGIGAWAWGDRLFWGFGSGYGIKDIRQAFETSLEAGINFFDTAEAYGQGKSEKFLGEFLRGSDREVVIATKFFPYPWRWRKSSLLKAVQGSLRRLEKKQVDLYQVHWPFPPVPVETWASALAEAVQRGWAKAVGVSNYNEEQMRRSHSTMLKVGVTLSSNQVNYSLLDRKAETSGLLKACNELGITLIAYSPLAMGMLTGKYTPENGPSGIRGSRYSRELLARLQPLLRLMREIGDRYDGKTPSQVALNWVICKGAVPIPGAKNARQAAENAGAMGWRLSEADLALLDNASLPFTTGEWNQP